MGKSETENDIEALLAEHEAGKITRDQLVAQLAAAAGEESVAKTVTNEGRRVLLTRIFNQFFTVDADGVVTMGEDGPFDDAIRHQEWLFSEEGFSNEDGDLPNSNSLIMNHRCSPRYTVTLS